MKAQSITHNYNFEWVSVNDDVELYEEASFNLDSPEAVDISKENSDLKAKLEEALKDQ